MSNSDARATAVNQPPPRGWRNFFSPFHIGLQLLVAALFYSANELDRIFNLWFALVPIIGIPAIIVGIIWIVGIIKNMALGRWLKLASVAIAPLLVWPLLVLLLRTGFDSHWVRFQFNKPNYEQTVRSLEGTHPMYHSWNWGSTGGAAAANIFYSLVYDESDRVTQREGEKSEGGITSVRTFGDHFYLVTLLYQ
ncbi:MAG: hypothetical protein K0M66_06965 [Thiobacillus sp.]|nr:hypothetical protein [Thiobacillus sp.]